MSFIEKAWYQGAKWLSLFRPFSSLALFYAKRKRTQYLNNQALPLITNSEGLSIPVVVVGNISVGGTGKTPFTIALSEYLLAKGKSVGIVSRGYGSNLRSFPFEVKADSNPKESGDEPLLLKQRLGCPVVISPNRVEAIQYLIEHHAVDVILSDDGMQHYRMPRQLEIALVDGQRGFGNGRMLPEGPLREPVERLSDVDFVVVNSASKDFADAHQNSSWSEWFRANSFYSMNIEAGDFYLLSTDEKEVITGETVYAVSGIGNPTRFYHTLSNLGVKYSAKAFKDHHAFTLLDFVDMAEHRIVMTEKDAVKCRKLDLGNAVYLSVDAVIDQDLFDQIFDRLF